MSDIMEVCSTAEDIIKNNNVVSDSVVDIPENVQKCRNEEAYNQKNYVNVEKDTVCNVISQDEEDNNYKEYSQRSESGVNNECSNENNITTHENGKIENENNIAYDNGDANNDMYEKTFSRRILDLIDEDSNEEIISCKKNSETNKTRKIISSESEEDLQTNVEDIPQTIYKTTDSTTNSYQTLLDSDSEEDEKEVPGNFCLYNDANILENKNVKQKSKKKKQNSIRASKEEAMHKIYSESQRLLRETDISLPYHKPKQRTLQEFLNRRKISTAFSKTSSTTTKLKMSSTIISQVLAEKEKEAEQFYKSSDSEDDAQLVFSGTKNIEKFSVVDEKISSRNVELTHVQDSQKIEVSNKSHLDFDSFRVSVRKDFDQRDEDKQSSSLFLENSVNKDNKFKMSSTQKISESVQDNRRISRRLFENIEDNTDRVSDVTHNQQEETPEEIETPETVITSVDDREYINKKTKSKVSERDRVIEISNSQQCDSDVTNKQSKLDDVNNKDTTEMPNETNDVATNSNDCIITENGNDESKEKCNKTDNVSSSSFILIDDTLSETQTNVLIENCENNGRILGLPLPKFIDDISTDRKRFLPESLSNFEVRLKGSPDMIINLNEDIKSSRKNVNILLNRFFSKHAVNTKKPPDSKSEVTVIHLEDTPNGPLPVKETLPYKISVDIDNSELSKPGAKLMRLKEDLKLQMIMKRNKEWKQKEIEQQHEKKWNNEDEDDYELTRDSLDEPKETVVTINSDSEESEPEENDVEIKDKKRRACLFADDEAEVTDDDDSNAGEMYAESDAEDSNEQSMNFKRRRESDESEVSDIEIDKEEKEEINEDDADIEDDESERNSNKSDDNVWKNKEDKKTKRSIQEFQDEDSNITVWNYVRNDNNHLKNITTENENDIPVCQQAEVVTRTQECKTPFAKTSMLDFISPITQLSVLNTIIDSAKKDSSKIEKRSDDDSLYVKESIQSTSKSEQMSGTKMFVKKKLFDDTEETIDDEYLIQLCSGKFGSTQNTALDLKKVSSQSVDVKQSDSSRTGNKTSQNATMVDKDFDNSVKRSKDSMINKKLKLTVISSDDEEHSDEADMVFKTKKRPLRRLNLSDSEEENAESFDEENSDVEKQYVDYDSEENEVIVEPKKDIKKIAARFVEQEAELSESDWDSADEDERDLDKLDFEEGDNEQLNEYEIRDQLGKMHMKQMLDEDKRNVRLLKELLFEDGDLYTDVSGRERKFKWRNIDKLGSNTETSELLDGQDWIDEQDHEEEAKWHKLRQERDKFIEEKMKSLNKLEDELCDSQIFKPFKKIKNIESQRQSASPNKADPSETIEPIMPRNITDLLNGPSVGKKSQMIYNITKKSSFLSRGEKSLAKIASLAKQCDSVSHTLNTRNFVFQYISSSTDSSSKEDKAKELDLKNESRKRKTTSNCSSTTKKRRR